MGTKDNPADLMTKHLDGKTAAEHLKRLSVRTATGCRELAPRLKKNWYQDCEDEAMTVMML